MRKMTYQQFVNEIYGPKYIGYQKYNKAVVVIPAYH
jgi:hypothetical protein